MSPNYQRPSASHLRIPPRLTDGPDRAQSDSGQLIFKRFHQLRGLHQTHQSTVRALFEPARRVATRGVLTEAGDVAQSIYAVESGWLIAAKYTSDGRRHVLRTYLPGDLIGLNDFANFTVDAGVSAITPASVLPIKAERFFEATAASREINAAFLSLMSEELVFLSDRALANAAMSAKERIVHYLLTTLQQLRFMDPTIKSRIPFPLTQTDLGDALGLTHTYVSKTMRALDDAGWLSREHGRITFLREPDMHRFLGNAVQHLSAE